MRKMVAFALWVRCVEGFNYGPKFMDKMLLMISNVNWTKSSRVQHQWGKLANKGNFDPAF
jgi:hypothetical protein